MRKTRLRLALNSDQRQHEKEGKDRAPPWSAVTCYRFGKIPTRQQVGALQGDALTPVLFVLLRGYHCDTARTLRSLSLPGNTLDGVRTRAVIPSPHC